MLNFAAEEFLLHDYKWIKVSTIIEKNFLIYICVYTSTALAEAEIEYNESYESTAVYVKYKFDQLSAGVAAMGN